MMMLILLQHSHCTVCHHSFWTFCLAVRQPGDAHESTFHQICIHSRTCRTSILVDCHFSQHDLVQVPLRYSLQGHRDILPLGLMPLGLWVLDAFLSFCRHERTRRRIRLCHFCTFIDIVTETAIVSFGALPVGFPLPTFSQSSLFTLFCPLILDHGVSFINSVSGAKILVS